MKHWDLHLSDQQLLLEVEGELSVHDGQTVRAHVDACWSCRARRQELESAITDFIHVHQREFDRKLPAAAGPRALLNAQLAQLGGARQDRRWNWLSVPRGLAWVSASLALLALATLLVHSNLDRNTRTHPLAVVVSVPDATLQPGAALLVSRRAVCEQTGANNKSVPVALQKKVFHEYGIAGADPQAYDLDLSEAQKEIAENWIAAYKKYFHTDSPLK